MVSAAALGRTSDVGRAALRWRAPSAAAPVVTRSTVPPSHSLSITILFIFDTRMSIVSIVEGFPHASQRSPLRLRRLLLGRRRRLGRRQALLHLARQLAAPHAGRQLGPGRQQRRMRVGGGGALLKDQQRVLCGRGRGGVGRPRERSKQRGERQLGAPPGNALALRQRTSRTSGAHGWPGRQGRRAHPGCRLSAPPEPTPCTAAGCWGSGRRPGAARCAPPPPAPGQTAARRRPAGREGGVYKFIRWEEVGVCSGCV